MAFTDTDVEQCVAFTDTDVEQCVPLGMATLKVYSAVLLRRLNGP